MHLIIPFAAPLSDAGRQALQTLRLPHTEALLRRMKLLSRDDGDAFSFSPPHERALARALGLAGADGELPWGAWLAAQDGVDTADLAWGLLTPVHWDVGSDQVRLTDPAALALTEADSHVFFETVKPLFESEGAALLYRAPLRWYVAHESLADLPCASLDRAVGRNVDAWLPKGPQARLMRRLQNEAQMLLHAHALNAERESRGQLPVNSVWLSGCGLSQAVGRPAPVVDERLRAPALAEDWAAWAEAWAALDAELGRRPPQTLELCGERSAVQYGTQARSLWQRLQGTLRGGVHAVALLESL
ncbi:MAG: hypothetical protein AB1430_24420 [Pseudomonadota bacterium]